MSKLFLKGRGSIQTMIEYGLLYNGYAITDSRNIANTGWHVASQSEWGILHSFVGGTSIAGRELKCTGSVYWDAAGGVDTYGMNLRGSGWRITDSIDDGNAVSGILGNVTGWWTSTLWSTLGLICFGWVYYNRDDAMYNDLADYFAYSAYPTRLIKDDSTDPGFYIGNDGKRYDTVTINNQVWIKDNLAETKYRNGDLITNGNSYSDTFWRALTSGAYCYPARYESYAYSQISSPGLLLRGRGTPKLFLRKGVRLFVSKYGLLYNWYTVKDARGIAPSGWHFPTYDEMITLRANWPTNVDDANALSLYDTVRWINPTGATNSSGFSAVGSGKRNYSTGQFEAITGKFLMWYNVWQYSPTTPNWFEITGYAGMTSDGYGSDYKSQGSSVRLIKDDSTDPGTMTDYDGNIYSTCKIGNQVWTTVNLRVTHYNNGDIIPEVTGNSAWAALTTGALCAYNNDWNNA